MKYLILIVGIALELVFAYGMYLNYSLGNIFWVAYDFIMMAIAVPALVFGLNCLLETLKSN